MGLSNGLRRLVEDFRTVKKPLVGELTFHQQQQKGTSQTSLGVWARVIHLKEDGSSLQGTPQIVNEGHLKYG